MSETGKCNRCLAMDVEYDSFDYDGDTIWQNGQCGACGGTQQLIYTLAGIAPRTDGSRHYRFTELGRGFPPAEREAGIDAA